MQISEDLKFVAKNGYDLLASAQREEMEDYCRRYRTFIDRAKTEREAVTQTVALAQA